MLEVGLRAEFIGTLWLVLVFVSYLRHHPVSFAEEPSIQWLAILIPVLLILIRGGRVALDRLGCRFPHPVERFSYAAGLGLSYLSIGTGAVALAGFLNPGAIGAVLFLWLILGCRNRSSNCRQSLKPDHAPHLDACSDATPDIAETEDRAGGEAIPPADASGKRDWFLVAFAVLFPVLAITQALLPPNNWDEFWYHLHLPRVFVSHGSFVYLNEYLHMGMPHGMSMLYSAALTFGPEELARSVHWLFFPLILSLLFGTLAGRHQKGTQGTALLIFASTPLVAFEASWAFVDLALAYYVTGMLFLLSKEEITPGNLRLSAMFAGMALSVKHLAVIWIPGAIVLLILRTRSARTLARWGLLAILVPAPWYVSNVLHGRSPLSPVPIPGFSQDYYAREFAGHVISERPDGPRWRLPWDISTLGHMDSVQTFDGDIGPLYLGLLPITLICLARSRASREKQDNRILIGLTPGLLLWFMATNGTARYLLPGLPILSFFAARFAIRTEHAKDHISRFLVTALIFLYGSFSLVNLVGNYGFGGGVPRLLGMEPRTVHQDNPVNHAARLAGEWIEGNLAPDALILGLGSGVAPYYVTRRILPDFCGAGFTTPTSPGFLGLPLDPDHALARLRELGFTHVLVGEQMLGEALKREWPHKQAMVFLLKNRLVPIQRFGHLWTERLLLLEIAALTSP